MLGCKDCTVFNYNSCCYIILQYPVQFSENTPCRKCKWNLTLNPNSQVERLFSEILDELYPRGLEQRDQLIWPYNVLYVFYLSHQWVNQGEKYLVCSHDTEIEHSEVKISKPRTEYFCMKPKLNTVGWYGFCSLHHHTWPSYLNFYYFAIHAQVHTWHTGHNSDK